MMRRYDLFIGAFMGAAFFWGIWMFPGFAAASATKEWWEIATAVGTIATAIVAVAVPYWQHGHAMRKDDVSRARQDWVLSHEAYQAIGDMTKVVKAMRRGIPPSEARMDALRSDLHAARHRAGDVLATTILGDIAEVALQIRKLAASMDPARDAADMLKPGGAAYVIEQRRTLEPMLAVVSSDLERLREHCEVWMGNLVSDLKRLRAMH